LWSFLRGLVGSRVGVRVRVKVRAKVKVRGDKIVFIPERVSRV
jgi:hypothetical protein